ncbi:MAG: TRAP transporter substrate-binding protein [Deltaproteobacteria bacterium]|nr:TRAP transporter substrate-binding protein [Deltaproteobacteria bacterium]
MKKIIILFVAIMFLVSTGSAILAANKIILKVAHNGNAQHPFQDAYLKFKEVIETETNGAVEVQIFPAEQLGTDEQVTQSIKLGTVAGNMSGTAALAEFYTEAELFNLPFIFRDLPHFYRVMDGPIGRRIAIKAQEKLNCIALGWAYSGNRNVWNGKRPVFTPDDLKGLKIRVMGSPVLVDTFNALGAQATPMSFGEVYTALQQGVIDGAETDHVDLLVEKFYEVTKYVSLTGHMYLANLFIFSKKVYDKLPAYVQTIVLKAGTAAIAEERKAMDIKTEMALNELKKKGLKFYEVDKKPFQDKVEMVYKKYAKKVGGIKAIEQVASQ